MNSKKKQISVIISTYNRKRFLARVVNSILSQTYRNFELILINNGSTDGSQSLCEEFSKQDNRIKFINISKNQGASYARNQGIEMATSEYITFVDDDDYCEPEMLEFLWNLANKYNADISICGSWFDFDGVRKPKFISEELLVLDKVKGLDELLKREKYNVSPPTKLFRRSLFKGIRFKENVLVDDIHVIYKVFANANIITFYGKPLYTFVRHGENMTSFIQTNKLSPELLNEYLSAFRERTKYLSKKVPEITQRVRYSEWSYMLSMCDKIIRYNCIDCIELYKYMIKTVKMNYDELIKSPFITAREKELIKRHVNQ